MHNHRRFGAAAQRSAERRERENRAPRLAAEVPDLVSLNLEIEESSGGSPVAEKSMNDYATALNAGSLKSQGDVLALAARLEKGAANAYLGVIPSFSDKGLAQVAARLAADETMHWTVLAGALGQTLPDKALTFGA